MLQASARERWKALLASSLEAFVHHLIFVKRVYPRNSFADSEFLGIRVKVNRHPQVAKYISQTVGVIVDSWIGSTDIQQVLVSIMKEALSPAETYSLQMKGVRGLATSLEPQYFVGLEGAMRNLVLSVRGLDGLGLLRLGNAATFQIAVSVQPDSPTKLAPELTQLLAKGSWYEMASTRADASHGDGGVIRPIHEATAVGGGLSISFVERRRLHVSHTEK